MLLHVVLQFFRKVCCFPRRINIRSSEMAICGSRGIDGTLEPQPLNDRTGTEIDQFSDGIGNDLVGNNASGESVDIERNRCSHADRIRHLNFGLFCQPRSNDIFCRISCGIGGGTVYLCRILPGKSAAAVSGCAAIGIDNDLSPCEAAVAYRTADDKPTGGIDEDMGILLQEILQDGNNDLLTDILMELLLCDFGIMLG